MTPAPKRRPKDPDEIARNMSAIRSHDNQTESPAEARPPRNGISLSEIRAWADRTPGIVFRKEKVAVFVDGDYWHGRMVREGGIEALHHYYTRKQQTYWVTKLSRNVRAMIG